MRLYYFSNLKTKKKKKKVEQNKIIPNFILNLEKKKFIKNDTHTERDTEKYKTKN